MPPLPPPDEVGVARAPGGTPEAVAARAREREPFPGWPAVVLLLVVAALLAAWLWVALVRARR